MRQKLNLITLGVDDLQRSLAFYEEGLGWKRSDKSVEDMIVFQLGGIVLALYPREELAKDVTVAYEPTAFSGLALAYNTQSEEEVNEVLQTVEKLGATIIKPAQKVFWGGYSGYFRDLDGYVFEVAYNPFWDFDENDNLMV